TPPHSSMSSSVAHGAHMGNASVCTSTIHVPFRNAHHGHDLTQPLAVLDDCVLQAAAVVLLQLMQRVLHLSLDGAAFVGCCCEARFHVRAQLRDFLLQLALQLAGL